MREMFAGEGWQQRWQSRGWKLNRTQENDNGGGGSSKHWQRPVPLPSLHPPPPPRPPPPLGQWTGKPSPPGPPAALGHANAGVRYPLFYVCVLTRLLATHRNPNTRGSVINNVCMMYWMLYLLFIYKFIYYCIAHVCCMQWLPPGPPVALRHAMQGCGGTKIRSTGARRVRRGLVHHDVLLFYVFFVNCIGCCINLLFICLFIIVLQCVLYCCTAMCRGVAHPQVLGLLARCRCCPPTTKKSSVTNQIGVKQKTSKNI